MIVRKTVLVLVMVMIALAGVIILPRVASAITLKPTAVVTADTVTLGDVFEGLSENGDKVLGISPRPGQEMVLNARTLLRIAMALDLPWRPANNAEQVVITRAASIVDRSMIEDSLRAGLETEGVSGKYKILFPDSTAQIILPHDTAPAVEISDIKIKPQTGWFEAMAFAPSIQSPLKKVKITGTIQKLVDVPVLRAPLKAGDIIGERDLDLMEIKETDLRAGMVLHAEDIIGMTPRRMTNPGKPLNAIDIEAPEIIARGDIVTMLFQQGGMTLTASGKAMEAGAKGDTIRIVNPASNKTIEGIVTASKEVTINSF